MMCFMISRVGCLRLLYACVFLRWKNVIPSYTGDGRTHVLHVEYPLVLFYFLLVINVPLIFDHPTVDTVLDQDTDGITTVEQNLINDDGKVKLEH